MGGMVGGVYYPIDSAGDKNLVWLWTVQTEAFEVEERLISDTSDYYLLRRKREKDASG